LNPVARDASGVSEPEDARVGTRPCTWGCEAHERRNTWPPDKVFALIQAGLLQGKSIGFLATKVYVPTQQEISKNSWADDTKCVIDEWILPEYELVTPREEQPRIAAFTSLRELH
jgi:hypothetical protein